MGRYKDSFVNTGRKFRVVGVVIHYVLLAVGAVFLVVGSVKLITALSVLLSVLIKNSFSSSYDDFSGFLVVLAVIATLFVVYFCRKRKRALFGVAFYGYAVAYFVTATAAVLIWSTATDTSSMRQFWNHYGLDDVKGFSEGLVFLFILYGTVFLLMGLLSWSSLKIATGVLLVFFSIGLTCGIWWFQRVEYDEQEGLHGKINSIEDIRQNGTCFTWGTFDGFPKLKELTARARNGDRDVQRLLGLYKYYKGTCYEQDRDAAVEWLSLAANNGEEVSQIFLFSRHLNQWEKYSGEDVKGVSFLMEAAKSGHPSAQYILGVLYLHGLGVEQDNKKMEEWLVKATESEHHLGLPYINLIAMMFLSEAYKSEKLQNSEKANFWKDATDKFKEKNQLLGDRLPNGEIKQTKSSYQLRLEKNIAGCIAGSISDCMFQSFLIKI